MTPDHFIEDVIAFMDKRYADIENFEEFETFISSIEGMKEFDKCGSIYNLIKRYPEQVFGDEPISIESTVSLIEHKLKDLKKPISTPEWLIDGVKIVVDEVKGFTRRLTEACSIKLQGGYPPCDKLLTKDKIFLNRAMRDEDKTIIIFENDQFTVELKRGYNYGELEIKKK